MGGKKSNHLRRLLRSVGKVRTWQLFLILVPLLFVAATLLRLDHLRMAELRTAVLRADAAGEDVEEPLTELKSFVFSHIVVNITESNGMSTISFGTGPFYLEQSYRRAANAAIEAAEGQLIDDSNPNGNIYAAVAAICQPQAIANGWAWSHPDYLKCWTTELDKYPTTDSLSPTVLSAAVPSTELYRKNYASPVWAPTSAGFVLLACLVLAIIIVIRIIVWFFVRIALFFVKND